jgi:hypothetical protein
MDRLLDIRVTDLSLPILQRSEPRYAARWRDRDPCSGDPPVSG